ncbi:hypothetical protein O4U47_05995 [Nocardiopsis sp. LSu2-4]|uniref:Uncharacterized protein n=1 Tax=Nocardiopsis suaedae TaxID=3018444 RepID=A0ABT4THB9_9ACTN|nr:hypothetical protein [Nocardiopsis suaedae]
MLFEIGTNGDRIPDVSSVHHIKGASIGWTYGYRTSSNSARAFRACILTSVQYKCSSTPNRTSWW